MANLFFPVEDQRIKAYLLVPYPLIYLKYSLSLYLVNGRALWAVDILFLKIILYKIFVINASPEVKPIPE